MSIVILAIFILVLDLYLSKKGKTITERVLDPLTKRKGHIIEAPDDATYARQEIIQKNQEQGLDTRLEDL